MFKTHLLKNDPLKVNVWGFPLKKFVKLDNKSDFQTLQAHMEEHESTPDLAKVCVIWGNKRQHGFPEEMQIRPTFIFSRCPLWSTEPTTTNSRQLEISGWDFYSGKAYLLFWSHRMKTDSPLHSCSMVICIFLIIHYCKENISTEFWNVFTLNMAVQCNYWIFLVVMSAFLLIFLPLHIVSACFNWRE